MYITGNLHLFWLWKVGTKKERRLYFWVQVLRGQRPELTDLLLVESLKCTISVPILSKTEKTDFIFYDSIFSQNIILFIGKEYLRKVKQKKKQRYELVHSRQWRHFIIFRRCDGKSPLFLFENVNKSEIMEYVYWGQ